MKIHQAPIEHGCFYSNRKRETGWVRGRSYECVRMNMLCVRKSIYCIDSEGYLISFSNNSIESTCSSSKPHPSPHTHTFTQLCLPPLGIQRSLASHHFCLCVFAPPPPSSMDFLSERERVVCNQLTTTDNPAIHPLCPVHLERSEWRRGKKWKRWELSGQRGRRREEEVGGMYLCMCVCVCMCGGREVVDLPVAMRETAAVSL